MILSTVTVPKFLTGSSAKLEEIGLKNAFLEKFWRDLAYAVDYHHTGHIEMFNSTLSKYFSKEH